MSESNIGTAVLSLRVDTGSALQSLTQFRQQVERELQNTGSVDFRGLEENARRSGQRAGRALADGVQRATQNLSFDSITEALDFSGALNGTLRDLRQYRDALVALREVTNATSPGFYELNDAIEATSQAIRNYRSSTDALQDSAARVAARELTQEMRRQRDVVLENARTDRQWADAIRTIEVAQRSAAAATREANKAFRDQAAAVASVAAKGAKDVGGTLGAVGRGVGATARGAVNLGRAGYNLGAEFGIFEEPRTGPIKKAIQEVIDRFKFLGEQANTTRGVILRSIEGIGTAGVLSEIAANADKLRAALGGVSAAADTANGALNWLSGVGQGAANLTSGVPVLGDLLQGLASAEKAAAGVSGLGDVLAHLGATAGGAAVTGIETLVNTVGHLPPAIQAAVLAAAGLSTVFKEKPVVSGLTRLIEYLETARDTSLQVRTGLQSMLELATRLEMPALPQYQERGLQRLDMQFANTNGLAPGAESTVRITDEITGNIKEVKAEAVAVNGEWARGARYLEKLNAEMQRLVQQGLMLESNQLPGVAATYLPNPNQYAGPGATAPGLPPNLLEDDLAEVQARRLGIEEARAEVAAKALALDQKEFAIRRFRAGGPTSVGIDGRLPDGSYEPGSPGDIANQRKAEQKRLANRNNRFREAGSNALIGGAFPALFGQGLGASVGGALGGGAGGFIGGQFGFGLSLIGTAVGAQFDEAINKLKTLGDSLDDPLGKFSALSEAGLLSSKGLEKQVKALIDTGREAEAAALIQQDLAASYDDLQGAKELAASSDELNRSWSRLQVVLGQLAGSEIVSLLSDTSSALNVFAEAIRNLKGVIPGPVREATDSSLKSVALGSLLPGLKTVQDAAKYIPGAENLFGGKGDNKTADLQKQNELLANAKQNYADLNTLAYQLTTAQSQGNKQLELAKQIQQVRLTLEKDLATNQDPTKQQGLKDAANKQIYSLQLQQQQLVRTAALEAETASKRLDAARQLQGLDGAALASAQQQLKIEELKTEQRKAQANYTKLLGESGGDKSTPAVKEAAAKLEAAGSNLKAAMIEGSEAARRNFDDAAKNLRQTFEGNFKFLTRAAQQEVLANARKDIAAGVESGSINRKFLNARNPEEVLQAAQASRSQLDAIKNFQDASREYTGAVYKANQAIDNANSSLADAANKIVALQGSLDGLASKDWVVNVSVTGDSAANVRVD